MLFSDNTVKKSDVKKRKAAQLESQALSTNSQATPTNAQAPPQNIQAPPLDISKLPLSDQAISSQPDASNAGYENVEVPPTSNKVPTPPPPPVEPTEPIGLSEDWDTPRDR